MLDAVFARTRAANRPAFVPYVMAGDPDLKTTSLLLRSLSRSGADLIELGIPYGDPLADGPTIAAAGVRALRQGVKVDDVLGVVRESAVPVVLFSYYNPVLQYGFRRFAQNASAAGVAGVIVPDVAFEEAGELRAVLATNGLAMPLLIAPSTPLERAKEIAAQSTGFVYVVSRLGVTGARTVPDFSPLLQHVAQLRDVTSKPLAVGFGLSSAAHLRAVGSRVDGVIVGSALIDAYGDARGEQAVERVDGFVKSLF
ncbi:MAG: tryptophan synthase subunit alpha [Candidatus Eremiobacteraeota bacterium]|nr:tryptophan synthase subunit alpha [Candidatus Eremiobacteraeota bacterium]